MKTPSILFTGARQVELIERKLRDLGSGDVLVEMLFTAISSGTERANLIGDPNTGGGRGEWPIALGYSGVGIVKEAGAGVKSLKAGDRVITYFGNHAKFVVLPENDLVKVEDDNINSEEAAFAVIAGISLKGWK